MGGGEGGEFLLADGEQDAAGRSAERCGGGWHVGHRAPAVAGLRLPGRADDREGGGAGVLRGLGGVAGDLRGEGVGGVDQRVDCVVRGGRRPGRGRRRSRRCASGWVARAGSRVRPARDRVAVQARPATWRARSEASVVPPRIRMFMAWRWYERGAAKPRAAVVGGDRHRGGWGRGVGGRGQGVVAACGSGGWGGAASAAGGWADRRRAAGLAESDDGGVSGDPGAGRAGRGGAGFGGSVLFRGWQRVGAVGAGVGDGVHSGAFGFCAGLRAAWVGAAGGE